MPLVSGVCRTASAPMPSHGGSRLNASKPEASPKTRYPTPIHHSSQRPSSAVVRLLQRNNDSVRTYDLLTVCCRWILQRGSMCCGGQTKAVSLVKQLYCFGKFSQNRFSDRIASQTIAACAASVASSISHNHKNTHIIQFTTQLDTFACCPVYLTRTTCGSRNQPDCFVLDKPSQSGEGKHTTFSTQTSLSKRENMHWLA